MSVSNGAYRSSLAQEQQEEHYRESDTTPPSRDERRSETIEIVVVEVDDEKRSFKADGGKWLRWSKFAEPSNVIMPDAGMRVQVGLDKAGFIKSCRPLPPPRPAPATLAALASTRKPEPDWLDEPERVVLAGGLETDDRGRAIARMNSMTSAIALLSSGGQVVDSTEAFALARMIETWIFRGDA